MEGKPTYLVPSITTEAALDTCLREKVGLFAVEGPIYHMQHILEHIAIVGYELIDYPDMDFCLCRYVRSGSCFDMEQYDIIYFYLGRNGTNK